MVEQFGSRKDSQPTNSKRGYPLLLNLSFRELRDSKLSGLVTVKTIII